MNRPKLLIVDDDDNNRGVLRDVLGGEPYALLEAADGQQALDIALKESPDLVLLDVLMPGMDGLATLHKLKEHGRTRHIPVIMVTALNLDSQVSICLDGGAIDHIAKPFSGLEVRARVRAALHNRPATAETAVHVQNFGRIIGFLGSKGGVGTTTTAVNVALALTSRERSVAVIEMRPFMGSVAQQLDVTASLNLEPLLAAQNPADINLGTLSRHLTHHATGLQLLLAPPIFDDQREIGPLQAEAIVNGLSATTEYVIVDFPWYPSRAIGAGVRCCHFVVLVVELDAMCLASAQATLKGLSGWGVRGSSVGAVLLPPRTGGAPITVRHARAHLGCRVIGLVPSRPDLFMTTVEARRPLMLSHPKSGAAQSLAEIADRLMADPVPALDASDFASTRHPGRNTRECLASLEIR